MAKISRQNEELMERIDEVLHYLWDPIGVRDVAAARDEYHFYVNEVFKMLKDGAGEKQISKHLTDIKVTSMGLPQPDTSDSEDAIASILVDWKELIFR